jgi:cytidylate kinase
VLIAIDGPAGSGKSSVARAVAKRLGLVNLNTGATYRAVALVALREGVDLKDGPTLAGVGGRVKLTADGVFYGGELFSEDALRTPEVSAAASKVSTQPELRTILVRRQRMAARTAENLGGAVVEGRDIGTVVLPEAELKIFLLASPQERARRRALQSGREGDLERIRKAMQSRDRRDSEREASPLKPASDAIVLDTTSLSLEDVVGRVVELVSQLRHAGPRKTFGGI